MHRACAVLDDGVWTNPLQVNAMIECFQTVGQGSPFRLLVADYFVHMMEQDDAESKMKDLVLCDGLMLAIHASEKVLNKHRDDFPRYMKPTTWADVLYVEGKGAEDSGGETTYLGSGWNSPSSYCGECGFDGAVNHRCKGCRELRCNCEKFDFILLCNDCGKI